MPTAIYEYVSTLSQKEMLNQKLVDLKVFCEKNALLDIIVYQDLGVSNGLRPELQRLLNDLDAKKFSTVVINNVDRISRNKEIFRDVVQNHLLANDIRFISLAEEIDSGTEVGKRNLTQLFKTMDDIDNANVALTELFSSFDESDYESDLANYAADESDLDN